MANETNIEWCDSTFNPWIGCTRVSPACDDCYAARSTPARTLGVMWGPGQPRRRTSDANWKLPGQWQRQAAAFHAEHGRRRRVFCASLADWLDNESPDGWLVDLLHLVHTTPDLDWLLLSKRIGNWQAQVTHAAGMAALSAGRQRWPGLAEWICDWLDGKAPRNVWLGATVVDQTEADRDVPKLLRVPAAVRFLSVEPMLGAVDLRDGLAVEPDRGGGWRPKTKFGEAPEINWVICGGESGPKARPMHPDWARGLRDQCAAAGVAFNFKQHGEWAEVDGDKPTRTVHVESDIGETLASRCDGFISMAGEFVRSMDDAATDDPYRGMARIGKKAAGRVLDGRTHDGFPAVRHG